jgi:hypothetical protein
MDLKDLLGEGSVGRGQHSMARAGYDVDRGIGRRAHAMRRP